MTRSDFFTSQIYRYYKYSDIRKSTFTVGWGSTQWEREILLPSFVTLRPVDKERFREIKRLGYNNNHYAEKPGHLHFRKTSAEELELKSQFL